MTMLPPDKQAQEDRVTLALLLHLRQANVDAVLVEQPDRLLEEERTFTLVTSDALFRLGGDEEDLWWAIDVMSLALPQSHYTVPTRLDKRLIAVANEHQVIIDLRGDSPAEDDLEAVVREVKRAVGETPGGGQGKIKALDVKWWRAEDSEQSQFLSILTPDSPSSNLADQVAATIREPLIRKARCQAARACESGCCVAVVLDLAGHDKIAQGTHWLPQYPATIGQAVNNVLGGQEHALDAVLLFDRDDCWHLLTGAFPGF